MRIFIVLTALLVGATAQAQETPEFVREAILRTLDVPNAKVQVQRYQPQLATGCVATTATAVAPPSSGGQVTLRLAGTTAAQTPCEGWARVQASITVHVLVTTKAVANGESLSSATTEAERPWGQVTHPVTDLPAGAKATQSLAAGTALDERYVRLPGPAIGDAVTVVLQSGSISVTQVGRRSTCAKGHDCATLPSGHRVEGRLVGDQLLVEAL